MPSKGEVGCFASAVRSRVTQRISLIVRSLVYITGFIATIIWWLPTAIGVHVSRNLPAASPIRLLGIVPMLPGAIIAFWCFANFVNRGSGTPAPFDAPRKLVVSGPYCYVRNPMYVGCFLFLLGVALVFAEFSLNLLLYGFGLLVAVNLLVFFYEEPTLRRKFGDSYEEYLRNVGRWIPRFPPWNPEVKAIAKAAS